MNAFDIFYNRYDELRKHHKLPEIWGLPLNKARTLNTRLNNSKAIATLPPKKDIDLLHQYFSDDEWEIIETYLQKIKTVSLETTDPFYDNLVSRYYKVLAENAGGLDTNHLRAYMHDELDIETRSIDCMIKSLHSAYKNNDLPTMEFLIYSTDMFSKEEANELIYAAARHTELKIQNETLRQSVIDTVLYASKKHRQSTTHITQRKALLNSKHLSILDAEQSRQF